MIFGGSRLARRRLALIERSAAQRRAIAAACAPLLSRAAMVDALLTAVRAALPWATRLLTLYALLKPKRRQTDSAAAAMSAVSASGKE